MCEIKSVISDAIKTSSTLIINHFYCEVIKEPIELEVYPYVVDGDFLICYDLKADQPYAINLKYILAMKQGEKRHLMIPKQNRL